MKSKYSKYTRWGSADGRTIMIKDLKDDHLLNIIAHIRTHFMNYDEHILNAMISEANSRSLIVGNEIQFYHYVDSEGNTVKPTGNAHEPFALKINTNNEME